MKPLPPMSVDQARDLILRSMPRPVGEEMVPLARALGRVAVRDVVAPGDQPRFDCAAMDGWVVCGQAGAYRVVGESRAGAPYGPAMAEGEAVAISTGAVVPEGASALVRREQGFEDGGQLTIAAYRPGRDMRLRGSDFRRGDVLVSAGRVVDHLDIARVAAAGIDEIVVRRVLRVALLATGDEIVPGGGEPGPAGSYDALSPAIMARIGGVAALGIASLGVARDADDDIAGRVSASDAQVVIVIGGASGGRHDRVRHALGELGLAVLVPCVAMRPGKPFWCGHLEGGGFVFGLPGNPVAALVALELFVMPALGGGEPQGWIDLPPREIGEGCTRMRFARWSVGTDGRIHAEALGQGDSAALAPLAGANGVMQIAGDGTRRLLPLGVRSGIGC